jgi:CxxC-x17-CxxC domain-containing protein
MASKEVHAVEYADKTLVCRECGQEFIFTAGEQEFYQQKGLLNEPGRCPACRANRRAAMSGRGDRGPREMHKITCAECGNEAEVPFLPRNDKPVYCSACYDRMRVRQ